MKLLILFLLTIAMPCIHAADPQPVHTYKGEVAGVMCAACSNHVKAALNKLPGVQSVKVLPGEKEGAPARLVVVSTANHLTREDAIKALGEDAKNYTVLSLSPASP